MKDDKSKEEEYRIIDDEPPEEQITIPKSISLQFILDHTTTKSRRWVEYIADHYLSILVQFNESDIPEVCCYLARTFRAFYSTEDSAEYRIELMRSEIKILKIGLNTHLSLVTKDESYNHPQTKDDFLHVLMVLSNAAELQYELGCCMCDDDRPIAGLDYLQRSMIFIQQLNEICVTVKRDQEIESMWKVLWNSSRARQSENWISILQFIPEKGKPVFARLVYDQIVKTMDDFWTEGREDLILEHGQYYRYAEEYIKRYPLSQKEYDELLRDTIKDDYVRWCNDHCLFLNLLTEPTHNCAKLAKDDLEFVLDERTQWLLDDIMHTFEHCRRILYRTDKIDESTFAGKNRDEDVESLLDCYIRLYTLFDKIGKLIVALFPRDGTLKHKKFYDVADGLKDSANKFLQSIYLIKRDVFPEAYDRSDNITDPHRNYLGLIQKSADIRNETAHGTVKIFSEDETKGWYDDVVSLTPRELEHHALVLAYDIREILLTLQLAVEWHRRYA
ncbi:hypothetical protein [Candidatus Methanarcanum hacksteinii]|uniref:hypothetical protein n=1 Tax=Candidatus Methanarcanum hacksteinii TaxID=2911857 RepID=UPI0037DCAF78